MIKNYKVKAILEAVGDIVQPMEKIKVVQKEVNQEAKEFSSSDAEGFEIDEIKKIQPEFEIDEIKKIQPEFEIDEIQKIPPETEKLITKAEQNLEINKSQKKDNDGPLVLTNLYETADKLEKDKDKASEVLETQNNLKTEDQTVKLNKELSSTKKEEKLSSSISSQMERLADKTGQSLETNEPEKKDDPLLLTNVQKTKDVLKNKATSEILETKNVLETKKQIIKLDSTYNYISLTEAISKLSSSEKHITLLKNELKMQSDLVHKQQDKIRDYQESISNLKERISKIERQENKLYEQNAQLKENLKASEKIKPQNNVNDKILEAEKKIEYYQADNLRLSNEVGTLSKRLDNTKHQLVSYESNKQQIMSEIKNLNNVISRSNIIDNKFGSTILESDKIIIDDNGKVTKKINQKIKNTNDINLLVREIFKK